MPCPLADAGYDPPPAATNDLYSVTPPNDVAGVRFSNVLDVLSNDRGNGALKVVSAAPYPPGSTLQGSVQPTGDQQGILYTATYYGSPYVETFSYSILDAREQSAFATVKVAVGECPLWLVANPLEGALNTRQCVVGQRLLCLMLRSIDQPMGCCKVACASPS